MRAVARVFAGAACGACALCLLAGCAPQAVVDGASPRQQSAALTAGGMTEAEQYVEVRIAFDAELEAQGNVADDFDVLVNGEAPDARTMQVSAEVQGRDVVVRLLPSEQAEQRSGSLYFALYDGLVEVAPRNADGSLARVKAQDGSSNAVMDGAVRGTVPSGVVIAGVQALEGTAERPAEVSFAVQQTASLRCCTWLSFGEGLPAVKLHNHEFTRDFPETVAARLADTINADCEDALEAQADGSVVTVRARTAQEGQRLDAAVIEGLGVVPGESASSLAGEAPDAAQDAQERQAEEERA